MSIKEVKALIEQLREMGLTEEEIKYLISEIPIKK